MASPEVIVVGFKGKSLLSLFVHTRRVPRCKLKGGLTGLANGD